MVAEACERPLAIMLAGPTASGKTALGVELAQRFPLEIVSVDSAMVYRSMDIGSAKPDAATLTRAPHRLIDIRDPEEPYSAGEFCCDAEEAMRDIWSRGNLPLLLGGTMLYFRALTEGIADLPPADAEVRRAIDAAAASRGWPALHRELADVDAAAALRIAPTDAQRIQRALEVYRITGVALSELQAQARAGMRRRSWRVVKFALVPGDRKLLYARIGTRFQRMLAEGFVDEVRRLQSRPGLSAAASSMHAVGYRQLWGYLCGESSFEAASGDAIRATRNLAKRQLTWLRSENEILWLDPLETDAAARISDELSLHGF